MLTYQEIKNDPSSTKEKLDKGYAVAQNTIKATAKVFKNNSQPLSKADIISVKPTIVTHKDLVVKALDSL